MGFEVYVRCFGESERTGISRAAVRSLFPVIEEESEPDHWRVRYDDDNSCNIGVTAVTSEKEMLKFLFIDRPCGNLRLWEALISLLQMGSVVIFWPGGPPVVFDDVVASRLPNVTTDAIGPSRSVSSAEELRRLVQQS
jgi:hypothetical protein